MNYLRWLPALLNGKMGNVNKQLDKEKMFLRYVVAPGRNRASFTVHVEVDSIVQADRIRTARLKYGVDGIRVSGFTVLNYSKRKVLKTYEPPHRKKGNRIERGSRGRSL